MKTEFNVGAMVFSWKYGVGDVTEKEGNFIWVRFIGYRNSVWYTANTSLLAKLEKKDD